MSKKRLQKTLVALILTAALALPQASAAFSDTTGHWAEGAIGKWSEEYSIIQGYEDGTFRPDSPITRGAFAAIVDRFLKYQTASPSNTFSDIGDSRFADAMLKLNAASVMLGDGGKALPLANIKRQEAVVMIARAFVIPESKNQIVYDDTESISDYAKGYVAAMTEHGYINDIYNNCFRPKEAITRAEIVNLLNNIISVLIQDSERYSGDIYGTLMVNATENVDLKNMNIYGDLILAPGVQGTVTLDNVTWSGQLRNFSGVEPVIVKVNTSDPIPVEDPNPTEPDPTSGIKPSEIYTPSDTTGEYITYSGKQIPVYEGAKSSRLYPGDFYWEDDRLIYVGDEFETRFGIDVSAYQNRASTNNTIDWDAVADDGVEFAMVRVGLRGTSTGDIHADSFYGENIDGAMAAGIETGVYFFAQAITVEEAIEEADFVIDLLEDHEISGPVAYDWEMHDSSYRVFGTSSEMATACAIAFCQRIEKAGYDAMVYAGQYVNYMKYDQGALSSYISWYPEYKSATSEKLYPTYYYQMDYWQFSSSCSIDGIGGRVDANIQFIR